MPAGQQPSTTVTGTAVTVSWTQSTLLGARLGTYSGGGYAITRYAAAGGSPITPASSCATPVSGSTATLQCTESGVPYGAWKYSVTPVLNSFTGTESAQSASVTVATAAPVLGSVAAQNPATGSNVGSIQVSWSAVTGATGYNVYRRASGGSYDYSSPLNGATPVTTTSYTDPGSGLAAATTYDYVVRAAAGSPAVESASSGELGAATISRPSAPGGSVTASAAAGAAIDVSWSAVAGVAGYNVYRRTAGGSYNFAAPVNGGSVVAATSYHDTTATDGTLYLYTVRAVITGAGAAQVESANSAESNSVTADGTAPPAPTALSVTSGGNVQAATSCGVTAGTRWINGAGAASVGLTATIATPESGETVVFSATTTGSTPVTTTVAASGTSVSAALNLSSLLDGTVTVTARTKDSLGNQSATTAPTNVVTKDTVAGALSNVHYNDKALAPDELSGTSECGATIKASETSGPHVGNVYTTTVGSGGTFSGFQVDAIALNLNYGYSVSATDLAGNTSSAVTLSGVDLL
jgi:fibronectin type 3 domain-containing protein